MKTALVSHPPPPGAVARLQVDALERVVLVDGADRPLGVGDKLDVHRTGTLHRAFSILIFNADGELLLQRRAEGKYHFAGRWSNSCCGHPRPGEPTARAAQRRLGEELGFQAPLVEEMRLIYRATDPISGLTEHEYLHVYRGQALIDPRPHPDEVGAWRWMSAATVRRSLARRPGLFTPWFALLAERMLGA
ncbi:MAG: isopentenyl-diphosphate Delta-isomerase [Chromatiaceae bacterium]|nr:isopentenyl-diphosphate Delta-isomerase [Chromatiaceae bacterium]